MITETPLLDRLDLQYWNGTTWVSVIGTCTGVKAVRGGNTDGVGIKTDVGLLTFVFFNDQDPLIGSPLTPGKGMRVWVRPTAEEIAYQASDGVPATGFALFTGFVLDVASSYPLNKATNTERTFVTVTAVDAVSLHTQTKRAFVEGRGTTAPAGSNLIWRPQTTWEERIAKLAPSAQAPVVVPEVRTWRVVYAF